MGVPATALEARAEYERELTYAEKDPAAWEDIIEALGDESDVAARFWEAAGPDGIWDVSKDDDDFSARCAAFENKALKYIANQDDAALGKLFRVQIERYFAGAASEKLALRGMVQHEIDDIINSLNEGAA